MAASVDPDTRYRLTIVEPDRRWRVTKTTPNEDVVETVYFVALRPFGLECNCPAGRHGLFCKHADCVADLILRPELKWSNVKACPF